MFSTYFWEPQKASILFVLHRQFIMAIFGSLICLVGVSTLSEPVNLSPHVVEFMLAIVLKALS